MEDFAEQLFASNSTQNDLDENFRSARGYQFSIVENPRGNTSVETSNRSKMTVSDFLGALHPSGSRQAGDRKNDTIKSYFHDNLNKSSNTDFENCQGKEAVSHTLRTSTHYISKKGYVVLKENESLETLNAIKKELSVTPLMKGAPKWIQMNAPVIKVFMENEKKLYIPRFIGLEKLGIPMKNDLRDSLLSSLSRLPHPRPFVGRLRPTQQDVHEDAYQTLINDDRGNGGIIQLPCGFGKTITAISLISRLGLRAIVIVHKDFLRTQWIRAIETFMPSATIGTIQQTTCDIEKDVVIAMLQSISQKDYPKGTFDAFGISVYDECHHLGAEIFCRALFRVNTRHVLGLSATPDRKDGLSRIFHWFLGPVIVSRSHSVNQRVHVYRDTWAPQTVENRVNMQLFYNKVCDKTTAVSELVTYLVDLQERTEYISELVLSLWRNEPTRRILILSDRRAHLESIAKEITTLAQKRNITSFIYGAAEEKESLKEERRLRREKAAEERKLKRKAQQESNEKIKGTIKKAKSGTVESAERNLSSKTDCFKEETKKDTDDENNKNQNNEDSSVDITIGFYWGGAPQSSLDRAANCTIVLGSFNMASEGFDAPRLNTLVLASPKSDVKQACGRILRRIHADVVPIIVDIVDEDFERFRITSFIRGRFYKECGFHYVSKLPYDRSDVTNIGQQKLL